MNYEKYLKDPETVMSELKAISPSIDAVKIGGGSFVIVTSNDLTPEEIAAVLAYDAYTLRQI